MESYPANTIIPAQRKFTGYSLANSGILKKRWLYHTIFWICYYLFVVLLFLSLYSVHDITFFLQLIPFFPIQIALTYFNLYVLIPRFLFTKKYFLYFITLLFSIFVAGALNVLLHKLYVYYGYSIYAKESQFNVRSMGIQVVDDVYMLGLATAAKFLKDSLLHRQWVKEKEKQYLETELNLLKSQIQPHFFFNTLNNLYSLTLKKSDLAPEIVLKLSALMSYMLYESNAALVPLAKEVSYLENYIDVEKLRFGQRLSVEFEKKGNMEQVNIPPMILILFVENSFKHGVKHNINKIAIDISLEVDEKYLFFRVTNPLSQQDMAVGQNGIGLKNGRRRLDLLYGQDYSLDLATTDQQFIVSLKMPIC